MGVEPARVPNQDGCLVSKGFTPTKNRGVKEQKLLFLLVELAETVYTLYGKRSISAAGNGNFRQETEDVGANGRILFLQTSS